MAFHFMAFSQQVSIGTGTAVGPSPWNPYFSFSYVQTIYLASEIAATGNITSIDYYYNGAALDLSDSINVYMGLTAKNSFSGNGTDWVPVASLTQVYGGRLTGYTIPGWVTITFPTAFPYSASAGNLVIGIDENKTGDNGLPRFAASIIGTNRVLAYSNDAINPDPASPPQSSYSNNVGNIRLNGLTAAPCQPLSQLAISNATLTGATATWQAPTVGNTPSQYNYEVRTSGTPGSGAIGLVKSGNSPTTTLVLTGLSPSFTYTLYVRPDCGSGTTGPWSSIVFYTLCDKVTSFSENFDGVVTPAFPNCWRKVGTQGVARTQSSAIVPLPPSQPNVLFMTSSSPTNRSVVAMPAISTAGVAGYKLKFSARSNTTVGGVIQVGYLTNPNDSSTFVAIQDITTTSIGAWSNYTVTPTGVTGASVVFAFRHTGNPSNSVLIDDVSWETTINCVQPNTLVVSNITTTGAKLSWTPPSTTSPSSYDVYSSLSSTSPIATTTPTATGIAVTNYTFTGLTQTTKYYVWVRSDCGAGGKSVWSVADSFTTAAPSVCNAPTAVVSSNITTTTAKIDWTAPATAPASYDVYYSPSNVAPIATTTPSATGIAVTTYNMTALTAATQYYVWVRSVCGATSKSAWTTVVNLTTLTPCDSPSTTVISNITTTSAQVSWTAPATAPASYDVYYSTSNISPTGTTTPTATSIAVTTYNMVGLIATTKYYVWVRCLCSKANRLIPYTVSRCPTS